MLETPPSHLGQSTTFFLNLFIYFEAPLCCDWKGRVASSQSFTLCPAPTEIPRHSHSISCAQQEIELLAPSTDRDHTSFSFYFCLFAPHIYGFHANPVRGESHIQHDA